MTAQEPRMDDQATGPVDTNPGRGAAPVAAEGRLGKKWMKPLVTLASLVGALTVFDGVATWHEVAVLQIAEEGNPILRFIEGLVGFTGSMVIRVVAGLGLLAAILYWADRGGDRARRTFVLGLFICLVAFSLLAFYHSIIIWHFML